MSPYKHAKLCYYNLLGVKILVVIKEECKNLYTLYSSSHSVIQDNLKKK